MMDISESIPAFEGVTPEQQESNRRNGIAGHAVVDGKRRQAKNLDSLRKMVGSTKIEP